MFQRRPAHLTLFALLAAVALLAVPISSAAHDFEPEREVLIQVFPEHIDVMIVYAEAPGERTDLFGAQFGLVFGDAVDEAFEDLAARAVLPRMLDGLRFEVEGEVAETGEPQVKIDQQDDHFSAAAFVRYELDEMDEDHRRTFIVRADDRPFLNTDVVIYGGDGVEPIEADAPRVDGVDAHQFTLYRGNKHSVTFQR